MLTGDLAVEAGRILEETEGEFLHGWEEIENETNGGRGAAAEYVRTLRQVAETARVHITGALAANHMFLLQSAIRLRSSSFSGELRLGFRLV